MTLSISRNNVFIAESANKHDFTHDQGSADSVESWPVTTSQ
jgi:hypothetical protein